MIFLILCTLIIILIVSISTRRIKPNSYTEIFREGFINSIKSRTK